MQLKRKTVSIGILHLSIYEFLSVIRCLFRKRKQNSGRKPKRTPFPAYQPKYIKFARRTRTHIEPEKGSEKGLSRHAENEGNPKREKKPISKLKNLRYPPISNDEVEHIRKAELDRVGNIPRDIICSLESKENSKKVWGLIDEFRVRVSCPQLERALGMISFQNKIYNL